jgi:predicted ATPase
MYLKTLGPLSLEGSSLQRPKALLLLAYLALEGQRSRRYMAELFYRDTSDPMNNLSRALFHFRQHAPGIIDANNKNIWTNIPCDATELLNLSDAKNFEKAVGLYQGAFVMDYNLPPGEELEEWLYATREILANKARQCFLSLAEQEVKKGNLAQATLLAEKAYRLKETSELGPDDFARVYHLLKITHSPLASNLLKEAKEFDISLDIVHTNILFQTPEIPLTFIDTPHNLPLNKTSFVGREQELLEIAQKLSQNDCRLLTLHGMGGIGKSRTSIEVAYQQLQQTQFIDGVFFIALDGIRSASQIPLTISENLDIDMQGPDDVLKQVKTFIDKKKCLLILDNFEHLMEAATLPSELLASCPNLKIMVTTREVLNVDEEWVKNLEGLQYPQSKAITLEEAQDFEAIHLFTQRAKKTKLEFSPNEDNIATIIEICQLVEGVPLALELAATWVRFMTLDDIVEQIKTNLSFLANQSRNSYERHKSIRAVFEHSWKLLTPKEQEVFRKLSVFVGSFNRQAAAEVAGATLPILTSLVNKSLLRVMPNGRYSRHFLIHEFSQEKLQETPDDLVRTKEQHASYYLNFLSGNSEAILGGDQKRVLEEIEMEIDNIFVAWPLFFESKDREHLRLVINTLSEYLSVKGRAQEGINLLISALKRKESTNQKEILILGTLNKCIAWLYYDIRNIIQAQHFAEKSLDILQDSDFLHEKAWVLRLLGLIYKNQGQVTAAKECLDKELAIYQEDNNLKGMTMAMNNLGVLHTRLGQYTEAETYILQCLKIDQKLNNLLGVVNDLDSLGTVYLLTNKAIEAENVFREGLNLAKEIDHVWSFSQLLNGLGKALYLQGNIDLSKDCFQKALKHAETSNESSRLMEILTSLAMLRIDTRDFTHVESYLVRTLSLAKTLNSRADMMFTLIEATKFLIMQGHLELAKQVAEFIIKSPEAWNIAQEQAQKLLLTCKELADEPEYRSQKSPTNLSPPLAEILVEILESHIPLTVIG